MLENADTSANTTNANQTDYESGADLFDLLAIIWNGKWIILGVSAIVAISSIFYALQLPNKYRSEALLAPVEQEQSLGGLSGQIGGLASLAGINLGSNSSSGTQLALEILKSRSFASEFISKHEILPDLMAAKGWNMKNNTVIYNQEIYDSKEDKWLRVVELPLTPKPSMQEAFKEFSKVINVSTNKESGMVKLTVEHVSPFIAQKWVNWLIKDINLTMKTRDVSEAQKSTSFLTSQLAETKIADIRDILYKLVEEQAKTIMFANVRDEYVFKTIDPALVPEEKTSPKRALIVVLGGLLGGLLGAIFVTIRHLSKK